MKIKILYISIFLAFLSVQTALAQSVMEVKAGKYFEQMAYVDAAKIYQSLIKKGYESPELYQKIADSYFFNSEYASAVPYYDGYFRLEKKIQNPFYYYRFAQALKTIGDPRAEEYFFKFESTLKNSEQVVKGPNKVFELDFNDKHIIELLPINTKYSEYSAGYKDGKLYFVTNAPTRKRKDSWTGLYYNTLKSFDLTNKQVTDKVISKQKIKFHEGSALFTKDGQYMYVSLNALKQPKANDLEVSTLKIFRFTNQNGTWVNPEILPFNSVEFNTAHPTFDASEVYLYFASDRPGGYGASDIYRVKHTNGVFGEPENLGPRVNTVGRESFPHIDEFNQMFYASDGLKGFGGFDVYGVDTNYPLLIPMNLGKPINTANDDFGYFVSSSLSGFFTSNRNAEQSDEIFTFQQRNKLRFTPYSKVKGHLVGEQIPLDFNIRLTNLNLLNTSIETKLEEGGMFNYPIVQASGKWVLTINHVGFEPIEKVFETPEDFAEIDLGDFLLQPIAKSPKEGDDLTNFFGIDQIYFELNSSIINKKSALDLAKIAEFMLLNPTVSVFIKSHTDQKGSDKYNLWLSEKRAQSTYNYLHKLGVSKDRLTAKGYGETQPLINCVSCVNSKNRRSEFIIN